MGVSLVSLFLLAGLFPAGTGPVLRVTPAVGIGPLTIHASVTVPQPLPGDLALEIVALDRESDADTYVARSIRDVQAPRVATIHFDSTFAHMVPTSGYRHAVTWTLPRGAYVLVACVWSQTIVERASTSAVERRCVQRDLEVR